MTAPTTRKPRAPRTNKATPAALREQAATAKAEATLEAQAVKVAEATEVAEATAEAVKATLSDRQAFHVNAYRNAESTHGSSKHAAHVAAVAFFRTLPESVLTTTSKSQTTKPVSARERAAKTLEAVCVRVERNEKGNVVRGLDSLALTVERVTQLVEAFTNVERTGLVKVESLANPVEGEPVPNPEQVEALVSALDQARVVSGKRAAEALASSVRETVDEVVLAEAGEVSPLAVAVETAQNDVKAMREAKKSQSVESPVVKTAAQVIGDAVTALVSALEAEAANLDEGQKSALLAKVQAATLFLK